MPARRPSESERNVFQEQIVPGKLLRRAKRLIRTKLAHPKRADAYRFVGYRGRNRSEVEALIKRLESLPDVS
jgi:hypothetical protein